MRLEDVLDLLAGMPEDKRKEVVSEALLATSSAVWVPNPGPQTDAYLSEADELFYGGQAGGGKTDLVIGLALTAHEKSLILREFLDDSRSIAERMLDVVGNRDGWNGQLLKYRKGKSSIDFGGCRTDNEKQRFKGKPHDLIVFDEIGDFLESVYTFIIGWNRTANANQRCRIVVTGNPPTRPEGLWVIRRWAAWLDPKHPDPAESGELRWYVSLDNGEEIEVNGRGPHLIDGEIKPLLARSRTFIRAKLEDNKDLVDAHYDKTLDAMPAEYRAAYRDGRFDVAMQDDAFQAIPTAWVQAAQQRWSINPPIGVPMCAIGVDVAQGGGDSTTLAIRHDGWYAPLIKVPGSDTPDGKVVAGLVIQHRRHEAAVIIDIGGGWGGDAYGHLRENQIKAVPYMGIKQSTRRTVDKQLAFSNVRTEAYWRFREALDPSQEGGSRIMLPPSQKLLADLCAPHYRITRNGIELESKEKVVDKLGRSPDEGDAVIMAWHDGLKVQNIKDGRWEQAHYRKPKPQVIIGHQKARRAR